MEADRYQRTISKNLRAIRKSKGLSAQDLADVLGISQAKISYIENCKGVLSARDVAILSQRLNIPVTDFFLGLGSNEDKAEIQELAGQLARYGAVLLAHPSKVSLTQVPFEEVFTKALAFTDDDRLNKGLCAALIKQSSTRELNAAKIFAQIGDNRFLLSRAASTARLSLRVLESLLHAGTRLPPRAKSQITKILNLSEQLGPTAQIAPSPIDDEDLGDIVSFVQESLDAQK